MPSGIIVPSVSSAVAALRFPAIAVNPVLREVRRASGAFSLLASPAARRFVVCARYWRRLPAVQCSAVLISAHTGPRSTVVQSCRALVKKTRPATAAVNSARYRNFMVLRYRSHPEDHMPVVRKRPLFC